MSCDPIGPERYRIGIVAESHAILWGSYKGPIGIRCDPVGSCKDPIATVRGLYMNPMRSYRVP
eukprot:6537873-Pyramimonas_sp.AAC.1